MDRVSPSASPTIVAAFAGLRAIDPKWRVEIGVPNGEAGWIRGPDFRQAANGPFHDLLCRTGARLGTADRRTIAALFALRFGWAASVAVAPYLVHQCVPAVGLDNISLKFRENTLFERTAVHDPIGFALAASTACADTRVVVVEDTTALLAVLRSQLYEQAQPVISALYEWSGFPIKGSWGMVTSSWAAQFITVADRLGGQPAALPVLQRFFAGEDEAARMQPRLHPVTVDNVTHLYQRRASCCRYYLLPGRELCASCPLVSHDERLRRNTEWMKRQLHG